MSDLFHRDVPELFVRSCFEVMLEEDRHVYQILTKRPSRAARFINDTHQDLFDGQGLPPHVWIGTSVEDQSVDYRIRHLTQVEAQVRFLSCEPLLGELSIEDFISEPDAIGWVIAGGESGPDARPMDAAWVRLLRDQCTRADVPFFFKQWGGITPKSGGRELDGTTWDEYPDESTVAV